MDMKTFREALIASKEYFDRSTRVLAEQDSNFKPTPEMFTAAQQVAHVAHTVTWFIDGAFNPKGFDMNFPAHQAKLQECTSIAAARKELDLAYAEIVELIGSKSEEDWKQPIAATTPVMGGQPRWQILPAIVEHTAHHRGALTVYSRVSGKVPLMPYMEM